MLSLDQILKNKRILILDDLVEARSSMKKMMALLGASSIDTASSGWEATQMINERHYDIILSDYNLDKGKDGQQVLEEARYTNRLKASSLFIMVTGENAMDMVMGALEYEPDNYITKPYTLSMLRDRMQRIFLIKNEIAEIDAAIDAGNLNRAIELAHALLADKPKLIMPLTRILGKLYLRKKDYVSAQAVYTVLVEQRSVAWARLGQAICMHFLDDSRAALALIDQCLLQHPLYVQCYDWKATILLSMGKPLEAQKSLEKAVEISPKAVLRQMELGRVAFDNGDFKTAEQAFEQAVRLGRYSCYKNTSTYLKFAQTVRNILAGRGDTNSKELRLLADKSFRVFEELREDYADQHDVMFDTCILESKTHLALNNEEKAKASTSLAASYLEKIKDPDSERELSLAENYLETGQHVKAQGIINKMKQKGVDKKLAARIEDIENNISRSQVREHNASLNAQGIEHYSKKDYLKAIALFDEAAADQEASTSVLMNAIQAKISQFELDKNATSQLKDCHLYFKRIGFIGEADDRYERYTRLKESFYKHWKAAGLA